MITDINMDIKLIVLIICLVAVINPRSSSGQPTTDGLFREENIVNLTAILSRLEENQINTANIINTLHERILDI